MEIQGKTILVLGGAGLVGISVCRELLRRKPARLCVHDLRDEGARSAVSELGREAGDAELAPVSGDIFEQKGFANTRDRLASQLGPLQNGDLPSFTLYQLLQTYRPHIVIDCVNTATNIAYRDVFHASSALIQELKQGALNAASAEAVLDALYIPRLIRHIQVLYRGMTDAGSAMYLKVGTTGTGGMGLNIPYTHSEEKPSRVLLAKSALAGAHSMLLFLMARTPGAPITKELKPAAAIAWKRIGYGPILRRGRPIRMVYAKPRPLGDVFSTFDSRAAVECDDVLHNVFIDTGENGIFSLEEFSALTTSEQMEFVTPEEIARYLTFEIEGGNTGHDVINALDNAAIGPSYRAGLMRHWALEQMIDLERKHGVHSVAFEMLGPPRLSKLLFEAHLLRLAFKSLHAVRQASVEDLTASLNRLVRERAEVANGIVSVGIPILLESREILRGPRVILPSEAHRVPITEDRLQGWVQAGWVDLRPENCRAWKARFESIHTHLQALDASDTSSRELRNERFWHEGDEILPGKIVGWIFSEEEQGARMK